MSGYPWIDGINQGFHITQLIQTQKLPFPHKKRLSNSFLDKPNHTSRQLFAFVKQNCKNTSPASCYYFLQPKQWRKNWNQALENRAHFFFLIWIVFIQKCKSYYTIDDKHGLLSTVNKLLPSKNIPMKKLKNSDTLPFFRP